MGLLPESEGLGSEPPLGPWPGAEVVGLGSVPPSGRVGLGARTGRDDLGLGLLVEWPAARALLAKIIRVHSCIAQLRRCLDWAEIG